MILLSLLIAFAVKVTGVFVIMALMIIPCATARNFSKNPREMIIKSAFLGITISSLGFLLANTLALSIAPTIIVIHCLLFFFSSPSVWKFIVLIEPVFHHVYFSTSFIKNKDF